MKIADWLRGVENVVLSDVSKVLTTTKLAVNAAPFIPANLKTDISNVLDDANTDLASLESLAGTIVGGAMADGVDDLTTLLMNTANAIGSAKSPADFSAAEKVVLQSTWTAMKAQGDTLLAQFQAGVDPTKAAAVAAAPAPPTTNSVPVPQPSIVSVA